MAKIDSLQIICATYIQSRLSQFLAVPQAARELVHSQRIIQNFYPNLLKLGQAEPCLINWTYGEIEIVAVFNDDDLPYLYQLYDGRMSSFWSEFHWLEFANCSFICANDHYNINIPRKYGMRLLKKAIKFYEKMNNVTEFYWENYTKYTKSELRDVISRKFNIPRDKLVV